MAQSKEIASLRMRLVRRGYDRVTISDQGSSCLVVAYEPLTGMEVRLRVLPEEIRFLARW